MGGCFSSDPVTPEYRDKVDSNFTGSVKSRSCTDRPFLLLLILCLGLLAGLTAYCIKNGDTARLFNGYDNCGNICGVKNAPEDNPKFCKGKEDVSNKKFLLITTPEGLTSPKAGQRRCVESCDAEPNYTRFLNRCLPKEFEDKLDSFFNRTGVQEYFQATVEDVNLVKGEMIKLVLFATVFALILVFLLRFVAGLIVWTVLIGATLASIGLTVFLWFTWYQKTKIKERTQIIEREINTYFIYAIVATLVALVVLVIVLVMRKRVKLVVRLFTEAGKAIQDMPLLLIQPLVTFLALMLVFAGCVYLGLLIQGGGFLAEGPNQNLYYKKDFAMKFARFARVYDLFIWFWLVQFCIGCQHMVIAGAVATWFFTRDKDRLSSPISTAISNLFSYHLGSVSLGSLIIAIVQIIRVILTSLKSAMKDSKHDWVRSAYEGLQCCFACLESILKYITRNAYIEVAMFGTSFCRGGQQAFKLLTSNALRVAAINSVGDFVLQLGKVLVVACTVFLGFYLIDPIPGVQHLGVPLTIVGLVSYFIAHCFFSVYEMVIDTIFLCFCEDCELNDGEAKPYFMSAGLMEFVEDSKRELRVGDGAASP
ncbi:hypothetical protein M8J76_004098 [Diaphorina citri]|nr:hypothetical protein M8J76_004098 [Diaphorina citri]